MFRFVGLFLRLSASPASTDGAGEPAIAQMPDTGTLILLFSAVTLAAVIVFLWQGYPQRGIKRQTEIPRRKARPHRKTPHRKSVKDARSMKYRIKETDIWPILRKKQ